MNPEDMQANAEQAAALLKTMSHPARLQVLCLLTEKEVNAGELLSHTTLSQSAFSQHLSVLKQHNLVKARKSAQQVFYSIADDRVHAIVKTLHEIFCEKE
ncbi:ArsR/SmtB family transcription factor [Parashewanella tropica]|uniref:ArsR/SmtB family transcription factor n=1 Tax=Parashewanella tropica TaxID=2547970 RepID=UPI0010599A84|nr:metalloregulator ArsR/SmtB family transcription factor [Parashewanella tropica]